MLCLLWFAKYYSEMYVRFVIKKYQNAIQIDSEVLFVSMITEKSMFTVNVRQRIYGEMIWENGCLNIISSCCAYKGEAMRGNVLIYSPSSFR